MLAERDALSKVILTATPLYFCLQVGEAQHGLISSHFWSSTVREAQASKMCSAGCHS